MQIDRMTKHLLDCSNVEGDFIEFGIYKGTTFQHLANRAAAWGRMAYGIDSFEGLPAPTKADWNSKNTLTHAKGKFTADHKLVMLGLQKHVRGDSYRVLKGFIPEVLNQLPETTYAFAVVDLVYYMPTKQALDYIWSRMSYGGTLYFDNFFPTERSMCTRAIQEFIEEHEDELIVSRQMMINGIREKELAIKCLRKELRPRDWSKEKLLKRPVTIAMLLKTGGGVYDYKYVNNLVEGIKSNTDIPHRMVCLTDDRRGMTNEIDDIIKFKHNWPKWWGKIELFRPGLFNDEQVFYFDLDTFIVDKLDEFFFYDGEFCALRDFYHLSTMGSGLMSWHGDKVRRIYDEFKQNPDHTIKSYTAQGCGDQEFISKYKPSIEYFQDVFPNEVVSYKAHCVNGNEEKKPKKAKIVCFHGNPRPHQVSGQFRKYWKQ